jgi:SSS family solute:Na+ symporter
VRLVLELNVASLSGVAHAYATMNFLHFAALLFAVCAAILVVVSLAGAPPSREQLAGLTYATAGPEAPSRQRGLLMALSLFVLAGVAATWLVFRG